ncbi:DUF4179 domain-containing protein [Alkaliphilus sp. MSJ-5]|uniref:DUF4179 domain-containing protein n=1 Tax=Alkaliphilus flagellatus TaxID=2841507 RepID=A0ABS6FY15_9FIRM|nr:DUF4179 domain-containing protein [Alkaliphilus flagellatus]MBU5675117.1 DUF4179 domain-containing protein [Alkaliphilus flagellatus]
MNNDYDELIIKKALNTINTPEYDIGLEVEKKIKSHKYPMSLKKSISVALAVCLCLMLSVGVMAATIPGFRNLLSIVTPDIALMLQPVEISSEDDGIKMEVVAAMNDDEMAVIYVTMQDLLGNRIDETLDIYHYSLTGARTFNCQIVNYDEKTKTATLRMEANGGEKLNGKKVSFRITSFLSDKLIFDGVETGVNLSKIAIINDSQTIPLDMNNISGGGGDLYKEFKSQGTIKVLKMDQMKLTLPKVDFVHISNIGYIDDRLHIQTKWVGDGIDDHGFLYFTDTLGNKIDINASNIYFGVDESGDTKYGHDYVEYIFDLDNINLNELKLMGHFVSNGNYTKGDWKTIFKIQSVGEEKKTDCNIKFDTWVTNSISVSPMGITLAGSGENKNSEEISISVNMTDGSVQTFDSVRSYSENGKVKLKYVSPLPLDVSNVKSVNVNGIIINKFK